MSGILDTITGQRPSVRGSPHGSPSSKPRISDAEANWARRIVGEANSSGTVPATPRPKMRYGGFSDLKNQFAPKRRYSGI